MLPANFAAPAAIVLTIGGLLACFAGYRLFRPVLGLYGFYLGAIFTIQQMQPASTWTLTLAAIVGGIVGAILIIGAYFIGVGLIGAGLASLLLTNGWHVMRPGTDPPAVALVIVAVLGALGALSVVRYVVIFGTAIAGAWTVVAGGLIFTVDKAQFSAGNGDLLASFTANVTQGRWWVLATWLGLTAAGAITQLAISSKKKRKKNADTA